VRIAIYPGSFDPFTNGHLDIAQRAAKLFDRLVIAAYEHPSKDVLFSIEERVEMARRATQEIPNVEVDSFSGLAVEYARKRSATVLVRGLRAISDFEFEFQIAHMNRNLSSELEATFLMTSLQYAFLSSSIVKEIARLGGALEGLVPSHVEAALRGKYASRSALGIPPYSGLVP
jgi:pantetheine-phosphate adenylyltransferase